LQLVDHLKVVSAASNQDNYKRTIATFKEKNMSGQVLFRLKTDFKVTLVLYKIERFGIPKM
jgi:hypothetical protein